MDELLTEYSNLGGTPDVQILDTLYPSLERIYSDPSWDNMMRTHVRFWISSSPSESSFQRFVIQALEITFHSLSKLHIDENLFYSVVEEIVELCPRSCLHLLIQNLENMLPIIQKDLLPGKGKALILLRICNDLIKRTQSYSVELKGRAYILACNLYPMNDRSGLNLRGNPSAIESNKISSQLSRLNDFAAMGSFGTLVFHFTCLDEIVTSKEFYNSILHLQQIFSIDISFIFQSQDPPLDIDEAKLWKLVTYFSELFVKLFSSKDFINRFSPNQPEEKEQPFNIPWHYLYSQELFINEASKSKYFWFSTIVQFINFQRHLLSSISKLIETAPEVQPKKRKNSNFDYFSLKADLEKYISDLLGSSFMSFYYGLSLEDNISVLEDDEFTWKKWREDGTPNIPKYDPTFEKEPSIMKSTAPVSFQFRKNRYLFLEEENPPENNIKPSLLSYLSVLRQENQSDLDSLYYDSVYLWKALRLLVLYGGLREGSAYDVLLRSIGSNVFDSNSTSDETSITAKNEELSTQSSEVALLYSEVLKL